METNFFKASAISSNSLGYLSILLIAAILSGGCSQIITKGSEPTARVLSSPSNPAPGIVRYCWEEPIVDFEEVGPGLNSEQTWYYPSHVAVREVRSGKWRPCTELKNEILGDN